MKGFYGAKVVIGGAAGATSASVMDSGDAKSFVVYVGGMTSAGTVTASIPAGAVTDSAGIPNDASTSADNRVTYNGPAPKILYVSDSSGSDSNDGLTWGSAMLTISNAMTQAQWGDQVWVSAGTYTDCVEIPLGVGLYGGFAGTETLFSQRLPRVKVTTIVDAGWGGSVVTFATGAGQSTVVDGFTLKSPYCGIDAYLSSPTISNNIITCTADTMCVSYGIAVDAMDYDTDAYPVIENNVVSGFWFGILCSRGTFTVVNNLCYNNTTGIQCDNGNGIIADNTVADNNMGVNFGFWAPSGGGVYTISNNIVAFNTTWGLWKGDYTADPILSNNDIYNPGVQSISNNITYTVGVDGNIESDPLFMNASGSNYHLQAGSPCIDAGDDSAGGLVSTDLDGHPRIIGAHVDIGAYEFPVVTLVRDALRYSAGTTLSIGGTTGEIVTAGTDVFNGCFYMQDLGPSGNGAAPQGIRVLYSGVVTAGDMCTATGNLELGANGEVYLDATGGGVIVDTTDQTLPAVLYTIYGANLGGRCYADGDGNCIWPGVNAPPTFFPYNKGQLEGIDAGFVTGVYPAEQCFYVVGYMGYEPNPPVDGCGLLDSSANHVKGVRVSWAWLNQPLIPPGVGWWVDVQGISSSDELPGGLIYRVLRPRCQSDIVPVYDPEDTSPPSVTLTCPQCGSQLHQAPGTSSIQLSGTATDAVCITSVEVAVVSGLDAPQPSMGFAPASFWRSAQTQWQYTWPHSAGTSSAGYTIWVKAQGLGWNVSYTSCSFLCCPTNVVYVSSAGNGTAGTSWGTAFQTVQAGINSAGAVSSGGEVWVAAGAYQECDTVGAGAALYGGFNGTETAREQRDWAANRTVLDGGWLGPVLAVIGPQTAVDGFTIQNGMFLFANWWDNEVGQPYLGGGICCAYSGGVTVIENNIIRANYGGGLYACDPLGACGPTLTVADNVFVANGASMPLTLDVFENGYWAPAAGAIYCDYSEYTTSGQIVNNTIICNWGFDGGGIYLEQGCEGVSVSNNIIAFNVGGGVFYDYDPYGSAAPPVLTNNDVYGNDRYLPDPYTAWLTGGGYNYYGFPQLPAGDIQADPQIPNIQWGDWHIAPSSPCRAAGATQAVVTDRDIDGDPREIDSCADIGAQECDGASPAVGPPGIIYVDTARL